MFANGWFTACDGSYGASACWLSHRGATRPSFRGEQFSWNFIRWRHRAYSTMVQIFRKRSHIIIMYFCPQTRSPQYKRTYSAQCWLIKTD